ncbi:MAG TPA: calcium-binding protein [Rhizomicrobium sp.]|jgi:hypothetical protein|nr:calcium-binding protein [Rhizomicrobium sp.]
MTTFIAGANAFDMTTIDLSDFGGGTITASSATEIEVTGADGVVYRLIGTGFGGFDGDGFPTTGTVHGFDIGRGPGSPAAFAGLSMTASAFMGFVHDDDLTGFETSALSANNTIAGSAGNDVLVGLGGNDIINLARGGDDTADGGAGNDQFSMAGALTAADTLQGGAGDDRVILSGDYSTGLTLGATTFSSIEYMTLAKGHSYDLVMNDANLAAGASMNVNAKALTSAFYVTFDASAETDGSYRISAGAGNDTLIGGAGDDALRGGDGNNIFDLSHGGNDTAIGGTGNDTFNVGAALTHLDKIDGGGGSDTIIFDGDYSAVTALDIHQLSHIDHMVFAAGHDYNIHLNLGDTSNGLRTLQSIDASALGAGDDFTFTTNGAPNYGMPVTVTGGAGDDTIDVQTAGWQTTIDETEGGNDTVTGDVKGQTVVVFGAALTDDDVVHGSHFTTISLEGDYSAGLVLNASHLSNISIIYLQAGFDYNLTFQGNVGSTGPEGMDINDNGTKVAGHTATIDASSLTTFTSFNLYTFDSFHITGGDGGGSYSLTSTAASSLIAGSGADNIGWTGFASGDFINGGGGSDVLGITFNGTLSSSMIENIQTLDLTDSNVTLDNNLIAAGQQMAIQAFGTGSVDGSAETDGTIAFTVDGGSSTTPITLIGGAGDDSVDQAAGFLTFTGGGGADTIMLSPFFPSSATLVYHAASDSTGVNFDTVSAFETDRDVFNMPTAVTGIDSTVSSGTLTTANFDRNLAAAINATHLAAHHAVEFTPTSGDYNGDTFLIVDLNGTAGYQAGHDIVIALNAEGALSTANFT